MSMVLCLNMASDVTIKRLLSNPELITSWISEIEEQAETVDENTRIDLDKAWHAIHFLLSGSVTGGKGPQAFLLAGGVQIGDIDVGYGPARAFSSYEVKFIAQALAAIPPETLRARFDFAQLAKADIYPGIWDRQDPEDVDYVISYYKALVTHMETAASKRMGMIVFLA